MVQIMDKAVLKLRTNVLENIFKKSIKQSFHAAQLSNYVWQETKGISVQDGTKGLLRLLADKRGKVLD